MVNRVFYCHRIRFKYGNGNVGYVNLKVRPNPAMNNNILRKE